MKLHRELTTRTIFRRRPRTHDHRTIDPELVHLSAPDPLNTPTASAAAHSAGRVPEFLMTEQTHSDHARPRRAPASRGRLLTVSLCDDHGGSVRHGS